MAHTPELQTELSDALTRIHHRIDRLERHAGLGPITVPPPAPKTVLATASVVSQQTTPTPPEPAPAPAPVAAPVASLHPTPASPVPSARSVAEAYERGEHLARFAAARRTPAPAGFAVSKPLNPQRPVAAVPFNLERFIGARFFAVAGGLIVTLGVGYFLKLAYDLGWFTVPPAAKCLIAAGFGAALLALGELARRKINPWASAGLSSAGVATLMASVYAAHGVYGLIGPTPAFALLVLCAVVGGAVACLSRLPAVAAVSMVGAYLAPLLVRTDHPSPYVLPVYLCVLLALGLWTAWKLTHLDRGFAAVRMIAWAGTALLGTAWCFSLGRDNPVLALVFLFAVPAMVHAEIVLTGRRIDRSLGEGESPRRITTNIMETAGVPRLLLGSLAANSWSVTLATIIVRSVWPAIDWLPALAALAACGSLAVALAGHLSSLRERPSTVLGTLGAVLAGQAGGLLIVVVSLALSGWTQSLAWLGMGVGGCLAARWVRFRALAIYGVILMSVGTARIALVALSDFMNGTPTPILGGAYTGGTLLSTQCIMLALAGVLWLLAGWLTIIEHATTPDNAASKPRDSSALVTLCGLIGSGLLLAAAPAYLNTLESAWLAPLWCVLGLILAVAHRYESRLALAFTALLAMPLSAMALVARWHSGYLDFPAPALMHPAVWSALGLAAVSVFIARLVVDTLPREARAAVMPGAWVFAGIVTFISTSLEVSRSATLLTADPSVRGAALSVYWSAAGLAMVVAGFARRSAVVRRIGLALMTLAAAKVLIFDLSGVGQVWRVVSTLGVGLLMIGAAMVYAKVAERIENEPKDPSPEGPAAPTHPMS